LDKANPYWRNSTVILWDGASYHRAQGTLEMLERLRVPIMMLGPYSYDAAVIELFFSAFKSKDVNPNNIPLGKTHFLDVVKLVVKRCKEIPRQHLILNWHHCLMYVFRYLIFFEI
jgi:transposase